MAAEQANKVELEPEFPALAELPSPPPPTDVLQQPPFPELNSTEYTKTVAADESELKNENLDYEMPESAKKPTEGPVDRDVVLARVSTVKKDALIKAWEDTERSKIENKAQKKLAAIRAWENSKKAELEAELKRIEEKLEREKAKNMEKMKNKVALLHKTAEEKRAITEAKRGEDLLKAEEVAAKCRATGTTPKKISKWFSK